MWALIHPLPKPKQKSIRRRGEGLAYPEAAGTAGSTRGCFSADPLQGMSDWHGEGWVGHSLAPTQEVVRHQESPMVPQKVTLQMQQVLIWGFAPLE